jgi:hypothetical protein
MRWVIGICAAICVSSAATAEKASCPPREAGQAYPWQSLEPIEGDKSAWVIVDVDRTGRPIRCAIGDNNIPDPEMRWRLCQAYSGDWRAPAAAAGDPATRTIKRHFTMLGYKHQMADQKARKQYFKDHPGEQPGCYPQ